MSRDIHPAHSSLCRMVINRTMDRQRYCYSTSTFSAVFRLPPKNAVAKALHQSIGLHILKLKKKNLSTMCCREVLCTQSRSRTGTSFTPLVFETSASTDSAIWAFGESQFRDALVELRCKDTAIFWISHK